MGWIQITVERVPNEDVSKLGNMIQEVIEGLLEDDKYSEVEIDWDSYTE